MLQPYKDKLSEETAKRIANNFRSHELIELVQAQLLTHEEARLILLSKNLKP